jgi:hypothetical protein
MASATYRGPNVKHAAAVSPRAPMLARFKYQRATRSGVEQAGQITGFPTCNCRFGRVLPQDGHFKLGKCIGGERSS